jgi:hypothetical protein
MMNIEIFKNEAIQKTLLLINESPENWRTFNDELHTYIIGDSSQMKSGVLLKNNEAPVLECVLEDSFMLITTDRIISKLDSCYEEILLQEIVNLGNEYERENNRIIDGRLPKTNIISINGKNGKKLAFKIDSYYPAHFARTLIINMSNYLKCGEWFWNPGGSGNVQKAT